MKSETESMSRSPAHLSDDDIDHFRTVRFFPDLRQQDMNTLFRSPQEPPTKSLRSKRRRRKPLLSSTRGFQSLSSLTQSSYDAITADSMDKWRKKMVEHRLRGIEERRVMEGRPSVSLGSLSSFSSLSSFAEEDQSCSFGSLQQALRLQSMAYDTDLDRSTLEAFRGKPLCFKEFDSLIRTGLGVRSSLKERKALFNRLAGGRRRGRGKEEEKEEKEVTMDGDVFRSYFLGLGEEARDVRRFEQLKQEKKREQKEKEEQEREAEALAKKEASQVDTNFNEDDLRKGLEKVGQIALSIQPHSFSDRIAMDSFQGTLTPPQFKHQLERSFAIQLTGKEAGALMDHFDTDASGTIEGSEFIKAFMKIKNTMKRKEEEKRRMERTRRQKKRKYTPLTAAPLGR